MVDYDTLKHGQTLYSIFTTKATEGNFIIQKCKAGVDEEEFEKVHKPLDPEKYEKHHLTYFKDSLKNKKFVYYYNVKTLFEDRVIGIYQGKRVTWWANETEKIFHTQNEVIKYAIKHIFNRK